MISCLISDINFFINGVGTGSSKIMVKAAGVRRINMSLMTIGITQLKIPAGYGKTEKRLCENQIDTAETIANIAIEGHVKTV